MSSAEFGLAQVYVMKKQLKEKIKKDEEKQEKIGQNDVIKQSNSSFSFFNRTKKVHPNSRPSSKATN
ncbi:hypothetical protein FRX31_023424 [Thalictrum thalictroides]|uniref:Uncharacterized protein n=1 Tax=Thalictrum thalictroides TaxID=46969 RepID=A0A7J6VRX7_THATH|nr:hypothetical protein FRX31_023424 [Thalictrum thalictroides]